MKNMKKLLFIFFLCIASVISQAQEVISSSGTSLSKGSFVVDFTLGECVIQTYSTPSLYLTQGFHQPQLIVTTLNEKINQELSVSVYPNPASDHVILRADNPEGLSYVLFDISGKKIEQKQLESDKTEISFNGFEAATYFIKVIDDKEELKLFQIIKE